MKKTVDKKKIEARTKIHIGCTKEFSERVEKAARAKSIPKSYYVIVAVEAALKAEGF